MKYEILEHTGDAKIRVFGKTKEELFLHALLGMNEILKPKVSAQGESASGGKSPASAKASAGRQKSKARKITLQSTDINALLVDFLSEVNYLRLVSMDIYNDIKFTKFSDVELEGELNGYEVEEFGEDIKAVTFHELDIKKNKEGFWETVVIFDI